MFVFLFSTLAVADNYAILIAGSSGWINYRHQADISTIYQMLLRNGYQKDHIIQFQYDDIANNELNTFPGQIFHAESHENVYPGASQIDVKNEDITAESLYNALRSLKSTSNDNILLYYDNHGAPGTLGVPNSKGYPIYGDELNNVIQEMYDKGLYKNFLFIVEACESGSLIPFIKAPNTLVISASGPAEESWSLIYDSSIDNMLTNEFTYYLLSQIQENPTAEIIDIFNKVLKLMHGSTPRIGKNETIQKMKISEFFGIPNKINFRKTIQKVHHENGIPQRSVLSHFLKKTSEEISDPMKRASARIKLMKIKTEREKFSYVLRELANALNINPNDIPKEYNDIPLSYFRVLRHFVKKYDQIQPDDMDLLSTLVYICKKRSESDIISAIDSLL
ncbi:Clan CD, family C13, asparaginyl endopeptidase-like cysteine peptidase [Histomonas meleagridis]|uniref:Clan CD, family C13, asparaginyl endopeptidase-like cysteine peptidase n=1 Tax=Histomonas meleagridis TaxID=135588 RepID=UPI00355ACC3C|nr:Clan CD, family C13, asparaginyl endopeptidase-like cysteine peptidase [Histomonas meleagridis]KAH0801337.1 Clan CD, family C13, asparaginyl endopeptidase-like cysteine peptidase [Histomonas meleagridis]